MDGMRIVVVEDQPLFRRGLIDLLNAEGFRVDGSAGTVREAMDVVAARMPDIVLMDLQLADGSGIDATRQLFELHGERVRVVMLSESRDPSDMIAAVRAGAVGYLTKDQAPERLAEALRGVLRGEAALSRRMAAHLIADVRDTQRRMVLATKLPHRERLTPRQLEILQLIAAGETTSEIAGRLFLSPETVRWHVKAILRKLKARTRAEAAAALREVMAGAV
jgi:DNA-binding NarL/FixJ family response regulator